MAQARLSVGCVVLDSVWCVIPIANLSNAYLWFSILQNEIGVAGTAGGLNGQRGVSLLATIPSGNVASLVFAADMGAHVSTLPWGFVPPGSSNVFFERAMDYAFARNVMIVCSASNGTLFHSEEIRRENAECGNPQRVTWENTLTTFL